MRKILTLLGVAALVLAGCGDDGDSETEAGGNGDNDAKPPVELEGRVNDHGTGETRDGELELELDDFYFGPTFVKGKPGETVTLELENEGDAAHTFTSTDLDVDEEVAAGAKAEVTVTLADSGAVRFICRFHEVQGMKGAFFFESGDTVGDDGGAGGGYGG